MLKKLVKYSLLTVGAYTVATNAPDYIRSFVIGVNAGRKGENPMTAYDAYFNNR